MKQKTKKAKKKAEVTKEVRKNRATAVLTILGACLVGLLYAFFLVSDLMRPLRESLLFLGVLYAVATLIFLYFLWIRKKKPVFFLRIVGTAFLIPTLLPSLLILSDRIRILIALPFFFLLLALLLYRGLFYDEQKIADARYDTTSPIFFELVILGIAAFGDLQYVKYTEGFFHRPFWWIALLFTVLLACPLWFVSKKCPFFEKTRSKKKQKEINGRHRLLFGMLLTGALLAGYFTPATLNLACDHSEATHITAVITEKKHTGGAGRYRRSHYYLILDLDNRELRLEVPFLEYADYKEGDLYTLQLHSGALFVEYYSSERFD